VNIVRYADDFIITGVTPEILKENIKPAVPPPTEGVVRSSRKIFN